jgi:hypothetical protein
VDAFNPLGHGSIFAMITPTLFKPVTELITNDNWKRRPIVPPAQRWNEGLPHSSQYFTNNSPLAIDAAQWLNSKTGGDKHTRGLIDLYPGELEYVVSYYTGGLGRSLMNTHHSIQNWQDGVPMPVEKMPVLRQFMTTTGFQAEQARYYEHREELQKDKNRLLSAKKDLAANPGDETALRVVDELATKLGAKIPKDLSKNIDWKKSVNLPFQEADKEIKELRLEHRNLMAQRRGEGSLTPLAKHTRVKEIESELGALMRGAKRDYLDMARPAP